MASLKDNLHKIIVELRKIRKLLRNDGNNNLPLESYSEIINNTIQQKNDNIRYVELFKKLIDRNTTIDVIIPNEVGITTIGEYAFYGYKNLQSIVIPNTVTRINSYAFSQCINLQSISLPNTITYIDNNVFSGCSSLENIILENNFNSTGLDVSSIDSLSVEVLVAMLSALADRSTEQSRKITLGETNLNKLTEEQKNIALNKNWTFD